MVLHLFAQLICMENLAILKVRTDHLNDHLEQRVARANRQAMAGAATGAVINFGSLSNGLLNEAYLRFQGIEDHERDIRGNEAVAMRQLIFTFRELRD